MSLSLKLETTRQVAFNLFYSTVLKRYSVTFKGFQQVIYFHLMQSSFDRTLRVGVESTEPNSTVTPVLENKSQV